jgi:hypothetical protein
MLLFIISQWMKVSVDCLHLIFEGSCSYEELFCRYHIMQVRFSLFAWNKAATLCRHVWFKFSYNREYWSTVPSCNHSIAKLFKWILWLSCARSALRNGHQNRNVCNNKAARTEFTKGKWVFWKLVFSVASFRTIFSRPAKHKEQSRPHLCSGC